MSNWYTLFTEEYTIVILVGTVMGIICRLRLLRTDYRQYPTYPHGRIIHIALGIIASGLGAVLIPALLTKNYTAVTFLTVAAQQFRDVRNMERQMLSTIDTQEMVSRGVTYIEGIAMAFEGRNYLVIATAFFAALFAYLAHWYGGVIAGALTMFLLDRYMSGQRLGDIVDVREGKLYFDGPMLMVDDIGIYNTALEDTKQRVMKHGIGLILEPKNANSQVTLGNLGQRQAILHDVSTILGVYRDSGQPSLIPLAKRDLDSGRTAIFLLPMDKDPEKAMSIVSRCPVLENAYRKPLKGTIKPDHKL
jgi:uncharacterized protein